MRSKTLARAAALALAVGLAGCSRVPEAAVRDVAAFLHAAQGDDRMDFEARIDRPAVRAALKGELMAMPEVRALQDQLGDHVGEVAVDRMISPAAFRRLEIGAGAAPPPDDLRAIRSRLKTLAPGRICLRDEADRDRCVLTFARQEGAWKLVALDAPQVKARALQDF